MKRPIEIPASEFKAKCLQILDEVAKTGCAVTVTKRGKPVARLSPVSDKPPALRGSWEGRVRITGDIVNFDTSDHWEANS